MVYSLRGGDKVMDSCVYQINAVHKCKFHRGKKTLWLSVQPGLHSALLYSFTVAALNIAGVILGCCRMDPTLTSRGFPSSHQQCYSSVRSNRKSTVPRSECKNDLYCVFIGNKGSFDTRQNTE